MKRILKNPYFPAMIVWFVLLAVLDHEARVYGFYWILHGYDKVLHVIGGIGFATLGIVIVDSFFPHWSFVKKFFLIVGLAVIVGVGLEVWEWLMQVFHVVPWPFNPWDTAGDLFCDTLGGVITFVYYYFNS